MEIFDLISQAAEYIDMAARVVAGAAIIAAVTPTPKDDAILAKAKSIIDVLAFNIGFAKNRK